MGRAIGGDRAWPASAAAAGAPHANPRASTVMPTSRGDLLVRQSWDALQRQPVKAGWAELEKADRSGTLGFGPPPAAGRAAGCVNRIPSCLLVHDPT